MTDAAGPITGRLFLFECVGGSIGSLLHVLEFHNPPEDVVNDFCGTAGSFGGS